MEVIKRGKLVNGIDMQIEDWSKDYPSIYKKSDVVVVYPIAMASSEYGWVLAGDTFRCAFHFENEEEAKKAFDNLQRGKTRPEDYADYTDLRHRRYLLGYGEVARYD